MAAPVSAQILGGQLPATEPVDPDAVTPESAEPLPGLTMPPEPTPANDEVTTSVDGAEAFDLNRLKLKNPGDEEGELKPIPSQYLMYDIIPILTESSGTWLNRGFWYTEVDAVIFNRFWDRHDTIYAIDSAAGAINQQDTFRTLDLGGRDPGAEGSARFTLGRFLFRDMLNRDHSVEFTAFGGGEWSQDRNVTSRFPSTQRLNIPFDVDLNNLSFDGSVSSDIHYASQFNSFETNYRVRNRMCRDRMVMDPCGEWARQAQPTIITEWLVGLRYFELTEHLNWNAFDFSGAPDSSGFYNIDTDNNMFGLHFGGGATYEQGRWSAGISTKLGVNLNDVTSNTAFARTDMPDNDFTTASRDTTFSFIGQSAATLRWHMRPNLSLRASWEFLYVTSVAIAPYQINFRPDNNPVAYTADPFYHGASFGFEGFW
jgi:hypothetical protein